MRNILIVEDEVYARRSVKKQIQECSPNGNFQVFEAENGKKALEIFQREDIGLVFTDIRMPVMDGLELLREIKALHPACRVVMISAYADFEYAKMAMKLGAEEYLLKPISETELRQCLSIKSYEQHQETDTGEDMVTRYVLTHMFSAGTDGQDMLASRMFRKVFPCYQVMALHFPEGQAPGRASMIHLIQSCGKDDIFTGFRLVNVAGNRYALVIYHDGDTTFLMKRLMVRLRDQGCVVYAGVSTPQKEVGDLAAAYQQAMTALESKIFTRENLNLYQDICGTRRESFFMEASQKDQLALSLKKGDWKHARKVIHEVCEQIHHNPSINSWSLEFFLTQITLIFQQSLEHKITGDSLRQTMYRYELLQFSSLDQMEEELSDDAERICRLPVKRAERQSGDVVDRMKEYARKHYAGDFTVKQLAEEVFFMNPAYLSHLFAEKTGESWSSYVKKIRMEKAAGLMEEKNFSITEIASMTGYNDVSLFIRNFKQATGMTPKRYRDELKRKKEKQEEETKDE